MQIKQLEFYPYINNNNVHNIFGEMAEVKDHLNNTVIYYLIIDNIRLHKEYNIMANGVMHSGKFATIYDARNYCQNHFESLLRLNVTKLKEAA